MSALHVPLCCPQASTGAFDASGPLRCTQRICRVYEYKMNGRIYPERSVSISVVMRQYDCDYKSRCTLQAKLRVNSGENHRKAFMLGGLAL
jgi:hypothetical protein